MTGNGTYALTLPPLSIYIHIPWCIKKCPYCDFNSHLRTKDLPQQAYIERLLEDFNQDRIYLQNRPISTIFIGGGTPSLFSVHAIAHLLDQIASCCDCSQLREVTLEANPGTFEYRKFAGYKEAGVTRLSVGVQSFQDQQLKALGRVHTAEQAYQALEQASKIGFDSFNVDLMHGLPQQSVGAALADLKLAQSLGAEHISWYQLTIEPNTVFYKTPPILPEDDLLADIHEQGSQFLESHGYQQYEVSAFAKPSYQAHHNVNYWQFGDYIGIGCGAHGKITLPEKNCVIRTVKSRMPSHYLASVLPQIRDVKKVSDKELGLEFIMNALRLKEGVDSALFSHRTGLSVASIRPILNKLQAQGMMCPGSTKLQTTQLGYRFLNNVLQHFMPLQ